MVRPLAFCSYFFLLPDIVPLWLVLFGPVKEQAGPTSLYAEHARPKPNHEIFDLDLNSDLEDE